MKAIIKISKEFDVRYLKVDAGVLCWEDAEVNGLADVDFYESEGEGVPAMPFAVQVKKEPISNVYSDHYRWQPTIDVEKGKIVGWPKGTVASIHYKVCDDGVYQLLDNEKNLIIEVNSYVPSFLGEEGDYIIMNIDKDGYIKNFHFTSKDVTEIVENDFDYIRE